MTDPSATVQGIPPWLAITLSTGALLIGSYLTYLGVVRRAKAEERTSLHETAQADIQTLIGGLQQRLEVLEKKVENLEDENAALEQKNTLLRAENHRHQELIHSFVLWTQYLEAWVHEGLPTPPGLPAYPWQVQSHLDHIAKSRGQTGV